MGLRVKKNDTVLVISGRYKGAVGRVLAALPKRDKLIVEGVNRVKRHTKPRGPKQPGGIIEKEMPIHASKVMLVDPKTGRAARFANYTTEQGNKVRRSKLTGNEV